MQVMLIPEQKKALIVHSKVASTALKQAVAAANGVKLKPFELGKHGWHKRATFDLGNYIHKGVPHGYEAATVVRHPADRMVSAYVNVLSNSTHWIAKNPIHDVGELIELMSLNQKMLIRDVHLRPQFFAVAAARTRDLKFWRMEEGGVEEACKWIGVSVPRNVKSEQSVNLNWRDELDEQQRICCEMFYKCDYKAFGYNRG